eukprot:5701044-Pyramimonas_sp.AAC.1
MTLLRGAGGWEKLGTLMFGNWDSLSVSRRSVVDQNWRGDALSTFSWPLDFFIAVQNPNV